MKIEIQASGRNIDEVVGEVSWLIREILLKRDKKEWAVASYAAQASAVLVQEEGE